MDTKRRHAGGRARQGKHSDGAKVARWKTRVGGKARGDWEGYPTRRAYPWEDG